MKILITGGSGFIGSALVRYVLERTPCLIVNVDKLTYAANPASLADIQGSDRYQLERADVCDRDALDGVFQRHRPDAAIHLAAESHVDRSIDGPGDFVQTNLSGTYTLLEAARAYLETPYAPEGFRFLHVSTDEVYGDLPPEAAPAAEGANYVPSSPYAATKAGADHLVRAWGRTYGLPVIITNCSNNYGPRQFPEKLIPHTILRALAGEKLPVYGDGSQIRDWLYVEDHASALYRVLEQGRVGDTFHVGSRNERRNLEVVQTICSILDRLRPRDAGSFADLITFVEDRPGHDTRYALDPGKLERELGWQAAVNFEDGLERTVRWYLDHQDWWEPLVARADTLARRGTRNGSVVTSGDGAGR